MTADFVRFTVRRHLKNHSERRSVRSWSFDSREDGMLSMMYHEVSSANRLVVLGKGMSFI